jgi:pimeloyl-ACP methyl ester carboxylesterase
VTALEQPPVPDPEGRGLQTIDDSVEDIRTVVEDACERYRTPRVTLFGSSRGAIQVLSYAASGPVPLELAILNNPSSLCYLSGVTSGSALSAMQAERASAARPDNYTPYTAEFQRARWRKLFGDGEAADSALQEAYIQACLRSDAAGSRQNPPVFRVPTESFPNRIPLIDLSRLALPLLVIEAEEVPEEHVAAFFAAIPAGRAHLLRIRDSNHFTLRNPRRFELANLIELAVVATAWSGGPGR